MSAYETISAARHRGEPSRRAPIWLGFYRSRHTSSAAVTALLPKDTLAFVHLPDFNRSRAELHQTDLYKIWAEPAVQDFLQKPRAKIAAHDGLGVNPAGM